MTELTQEIVKELLDYDPETGLLTWKERDVKWFKASLSRSKEHVCNLWNSKNAGHIISMKNHGYIRLKIFGKRYESHRIIWLWMTGEWPDQVDHENGVRDDNRWVNLHNVTKAQNARNRRLQHANKTGFHGIYKIVNKNSIKWKVVISKNIILGTFSSFEEAVLVRKEAEKQFGYHPNHGN